MCNHRVIELVLGQNKTYVSFPFGKIKYQKNYQKSKQKRLKKEKKKKTKIKMCNHFYNTTKDFDKEINKRRESDFKIVVKQIAN